MTCSTPPCKMVLRSLWQWPWMRQHTSAACTLWTRWRSTLLARYVSIMPAVLCSPPHGDFNYVSCRFTVASSHPTMLQSEMKRAGQIVNPFPEAKGLMDKHRRVSVSFTKSGPKRVALKNSCIATTSPCISPTSDTNVTRIASAHKML